ncbi:hypothetical protein BDA96_09G240400 [Sorghum bicolor]|uniref:Uncharacterized protein n=2 Tax=Sorghum bicolor TaxID=4558 RepID=A0A1Z5R3P3_SORBI|nr:hypothetical protein BDA96_09G240400 [Sorghum bicolor]OQU78408.1 hypothetical protein SORBI_3009G227650 [Sorghum bicolor]
MWEMRGVHESHVWKREHEPAPPATARSGAREGSTRCTGSHRRQSGDMKLLFHSVIFVLFFLVVADLKYNTLQFRNDKLRCYFELNISVPRNTILTKDGGRGAILWERHSKVHA